MILAIETSDLLCSIAFWDEGRTLIEYNLELPMQHAMLVGQLVQSGLDFLAKGPASKKYSEEDITLVSVAIGPGSFTGLRIGLSFAQGYCFARHVPIVGISNHQLLAAQAADWPGNLYTLIEARRNEVYLARHIRAQNGYNQIQEHKIVKKDELNLTVEEQSQLITAKGMLIQQAVLTALQEKKILMLPKRSFSGALLAKLGREKLAQQGADNLSELEPLYIRPFAGIL